MPQGPQAEDMQAQCVSLCLLGVMLFLCSAHARGLRRCLISMDMRRMEESFQGIKNAIQAKDTFQNVTILSTLETLHSIKPLDVCCVTKNLLAFYVDRVFKDHQELSPQILRKISSIANSFLYMQKTLQQCQEQRLCHCRQEATNATRIIHDNYDQLEVRSAAIKSLGELDVLLAWIDKNHQGTSAASRQET
ncbi:interleukin-19 [Mesoplodon densirostris]|uniref:interleukin-19 n=1 Tax=Mesoplodon densirostris TaxID=48708 RepID=UPI0028DB674D|nr:interleukin-19 [Mesoplodon densirostris]